MTASANSLSRQIFVLHKSEGHVRFALPSALANRGSAAVIEAALLRIPGVRLVQFDPGSAKLGIHYDPVACNLRQLALILNGSLEAAAAAADEQFEKLRLFWDRKIEKLQIHTPNEGMNALINICDRRQ